MFIILPDNGYGHIDTCYAEELSAAMSVGINCVLVDDRSVRALGKVELKGRVEEGDAIYRGWMLSGEQYAHMYNALLDRGIKLVNTPEQYLFAHHLPNNYPVLEGFTPKTTFRELKGRYRYRHFKKEIEAFGGKAIIVKDWVG